MDALAQPQTDEFPQGSEKRRPGRNIPDQHQAVNTSEVWRRMYGLDGGPGGGMAIGRLAPTGPGYRLAPPLLPAESFQGLLS